MLESTEWVKVVITAEQLQNLRGDEFTTYIYVPSGSSGPGKFTELGPDRQFEMGTILLRREGDRICMIKVAESDVPEGSEVRKK